MSDSNQAGNFMPKEELAASGSGHLLLTDFDDDEKEDVEDSMVEFANQQGKYIDKTRYKKHYFPVLKVFNCKLKLKICQDASTTKCGACKTNIPVCII